MQILSRFKNIKAFAFDMDGVLTDGRILVDSNNHWLRAMNIRDGYALQLAVKSGFRVMVISGSESAPVRERLGRLGITETFMSITDKQVFLQNHADQTGLLLEQLLFMGDDMPDCGCMKIAGIGACPADAISEVRELAAYISPFKGGDGCVRDVIEKVLKLNHRWLLHENTPST